MGILVRSKDRKLLIEADNFQIEEIEQCIYIISMHNCSKIYLGEYQTKEKAKKVLDMIQNRMLEQNCIFSKDICNSAIINTRKLLLFYMPQYSDVE